MKADEHLSGFVRGFYRGRKSVLRKNDSGCACIIDDDDKVVSVCGAHADWLDEVLEWIGYFEAGYCDNKK